MSDEVQVLEQDIDSLLSDENYVQLTQIEPEFDLFEFLETLSEEPTSLALAFLFDSSREHSLGTAFFDSFIDNVHREGKGREYRLTLRERLALHAESTSVVTEWSTSEGRRLDILIKLYDADRRLNAVVGIENKHWAAEQPEQVSHYQEEILKRFPDVDVSVLLFLAPGARPSSTANLNSPCPHVPCSYRAVTRALAEVESSASDEVRLFVNSLKNHLDKNLEGSQAMSNQIRDLVHALYRNSKHRNAIKHILDYLPTFGTLADEIQSLVEEHLVEKYPNEPFEFVVYPKNQIQRLQEIHVIPQRLKSLTHSADNYAFYYVLHPDRTRDASDLPDLGDHVTVQLMAWCDKKIYAENVEAPHVKDQLSTSIGTPHSWYSQWKEIWAGDSHQLVDLNGKDIEACVQLFVDAIDATFPKLCEIVEQRYPHQSEND